MRITNKEGLPQPFVDAVTSDYRYTPKRYSATSVIKGIRESILQHRHDDEVEQDASEMVWLLFGKAVHSILENAQGNPGQIQEQKLIIDMGNGYELSGIFDLYDPETQTVSDWKTASVWKAIYNEWDDYHDQLAIYAWMLNHEGMPCTRGEIVAFFKDHSKTEASRRADYPQLPVKRIQYEWTSEQLDEIGARLAEHFECLKYCETLADEELPLCTEKERWHKADKWAVKKPGTKKALRLLDSREEAQQYIAAHKDGHRLDIEYRPGEDAKCLKYCTVAQFCDHGRLIRAAQEDENDN